MISKGDHGRETKTQRKGETVTHRGTSARENQRSMAASTKDQATKSLDQTAQSGRNPTRTSIQHIEHEEKTIEARRGRASEMASYREYLHNASTHLSAPAASQQPPRQEARPRHPPHIGSRHPPCSDGHSLAAFAAHRPTAPMPRSIPRHPQRQGYEAMVETKRNHNVKVQMR